MDRQRSRQQERDLALHRALKGDRVNQSIMSRLAGRLRPVVAQGPVIVHEMQVLTDRVCRTADGSAGRIVIREANGEQVEVCVPA